MPGATSDPRAGHAHIDGCRPAGAGPGRQRQGLVRGFTGTPRPSEGVNHIQGLSGRSRWEQQEMQVKHGSPRHRDQPRTWLREGLSAQG